MCILVRSSFIVVNLFFINVQTNNKQLLLETWSIEPTAKHGKGHHTNLSIEP